MNEYLIVYGCDNDTLMIEALDAAAAVLKFRALVAHEFQDKTLEENNVYLMMPLEMAYDAANQPITRTEYAVSVDDGSWFGADSLDIVTVPLEISTAGDADMIEDYITCQIAKD